MRFILLLLILLNQSTVLSNDIVIGPPIYVNLINHDGEKTKHYVQANYQGRTIQVPIVNGIAPSIKIQYFKDGSEVRTFDYAKRFPWSPAVIWPEKKKPVAEKVDSKLKIPKISTIDEIDESSIFETKETSFENPYLKRFSEVK